jgi:hypothetical protein
MRPVWLPVFEPDAAMLSTVGDGAIKINQAVPGYFTKESLKTLTGIEPAEIEEPETAIEIETGAGSE